MNDRLKTWTSRGHRHRTGPAEFIPTSRALALASLTIGLSVLGGCQATGRLTADPFAGAEARESGSVRTLSPTDFVTSSESRNDAPGDSSDVEQAELASSSSGGRPENEPRVAPADLGPRGNAGARPAYLTAARPGVQVTVSGLVGQVNGRPIYVDEVLTPIADRLAMLGREKSYEEFLLEAYSLIGLQLRSLVENELLIAEVESELTPEQQIGLIHMINEIQTRNVLVGGGGSRTATQRRFLEEEGVTLEEYSDQVRRQILIRDKVKNEIERKVIISWRDIERYYRDHPEEFDPPAMIQLRIISVSKSNQDKVNLVRESLAQGNPFVYVAEQYTELLKSTAGLMEPIEMKEEEVLANRKVTAWPEVNAALVDLEKGEYAGPFDVGNRVLWVYVEDFSDGEPVSLYEAQKQIEAKLSDRLFREETAKYFAKLLERGNYDDFEQMAQSLLAVAVDRWAPEKKAR